ncbi:MAG: ribonuclease HI family protein [Bacteroidota bacterium]
MTIHAFTDGASRGNPGESGIGVILRNNEGIVLHSVCGYIGKTTNNIAEYTALLVCLKAAADIGCSELIVHSDSELMVRQLNGQYKIRNENLKKYFQQAQSILRKAEYQAAFRHVVREQNSEADALANRGIDQKIPLTADFRLAQE